MSMLRGNCKDRGKKFFPAEKNAKPGKEIHAPNVEGHITLEEK